MRSFAIGELALLDIMRATDWYEDQRAGLGREFRTEAYAVVRGIEKHGDYVTAPHERYPEFVVRRVAFARFPYRALFVETDDMRALIAVMRHGQDEERWKARLPQP